MTVQNNPNTIDFLGNGAQTSFAFTFRADDVSWISLSFSTDLDQILLNADQDTTPGGSVVFTVAPPLNQLIRVTRIVPQDQELDYTRFDAFDSESHEDALDKLTMEVQDLQQLIGLFTSVPIFQIGTVDGSILRWNLAGQNWDEFITYFLPAADGAAGQAIITDGAGNLSFSSVSGAVNDGTVDGQINIWDVGLDQWIPVNDAFIRINPQGPPTNPLGRISGGGSSTTDVRKAFIHINIGASVSAVWSTDRNGGTPSGFFSRSAFNGAIDIHDWGYWNPGNQTGITHFRITEDNEFIFEFSAFMAERAAALPDISGHGQYWARDDNTPMFTTEAGVDIELNALSPPSAAVRRGALAFRNSIQLISNNVDTAVVMNTEVFDTDSVHDNVINASRMTVPVGVTKARISGGAVWASSVSGARQIQVRRNGQVAGSIDPSGLLRPVTNGGNAGVGGDFGQQVQSGSINAVAGDYFEIWVLQTSGAALNLTANKSWIEMEIFE